MTCIVFVLTATLLSTSFAALRHFEKTIRSTVSHHQFSFVSTLADEVDQKLQGAHEQLKAVAELLLSESAPDAETAGRILSEQRAALTTFDNGIFLFSAQGQLLTGTTMEPHMWGKDYHYRDYYRETVRTRRPHISAPFISTQEHGNPIIMMTVPLMDAEGELAAIVAGSLDLAADNLLGRLIAKRIGEGGYLHLFTTDGTIILHPEHRRILTRDLSSDGAALLLGSGEMIDSEGVPVLRSWKALQNADWILAASNPVADVYAPIDRARRYFIAGLGVLVPLCLFVWLFMRRLTAPLSRIINHVRAITEGRLDLPPLPVSGHEEIGTMARAFNSMREELARKGRAVQEQKEFAEALVQYAAAPIFVIDRHHKVIAWNGACEKLTGLPAAQVKGTDRQWQGFYEYSRPCLADFVIDSAYNELSSYFSAHSPARLVGEGVEAEGWRRTWGGRHCYLIFSAAPIRNSSGEVVAAIETLEDITERKEAESRLAQMAHFDFLTALPNRALFFDRLKQGVTEAERYDHNLALLFLDLNGFKEINDSFGHDAGDEMLVQIAERLKKCVRTCDTVARMGGDEFTIILGRITDPNDAAIVTSRILQAFNSPYVLSSRIVTVGASIGISIFPQDGTDGETLLKMADTAMYRAKISGDAVLFAGSPFYSLDSDKADPLQSVPG